MPTCWSWSPPISPTPERPPPDGEGDPLDGIRADPARTGLFTDFDGTLSVLVDDPAAAVPAPGAVAELERLALRYAVVGVVSGRPVTFLRSRLGDRLLLSGLYGLESLQDGQLVEAGAAAIWRPIVAAATARAKARFGDAVEGKGASLTLHFRVQPRLGAAMRAWAVGEEAASGLVVRSAKSSVELHPPLALDKGTVIEGAARELGAVCFIGDDAGDLAAFDALDRLASRGVLAVRVAAATAETPEELLTRADLVVGGPEGVMHLLASL